MKFKFLLKKNAFKLPKKPGVYCFKNKKVLYIGKATNIQERVKNHFQRPGFKDSLFLKKVRKVGYIETGSEIGALIWEAKLIKKYQPKFNVLWRDDKNYFFLGVTKEDFPQVFWTHQTKIRMKDHRLKASFVGPFVDGTALKRTLKTLRKVFPYRSCKNLPNKPCLWYQIDRCLAPCVFKSGFSSQIPSVQKKIKRESQNNVENIFSILKGRGKKVLAHLKRKMRKAAKSQEFEKASEIRDKAFALIKIISHARIFSREEEFETWKETERKLQKILKVRGEISRIEAYDVSNIQGQEATGSMVVFIDGLANKSLYRKFKINLTGKPNDTAMIREILSRRFLHSEWTSPDIILIDGGIGQLHAAQSVISKQQLTIPLISLAKKENKLYIKNQKKPISLKNLPREIFNLILQLRDEAHRFAISYHHKLRETSIH